MDQISTSRIIDLGGMRYKLSNDYNGGTTEVYRQVADKLNMDRTRLDASGNLSYICAQASSFAEIGGVGALSSEHSNNDTTFTEISVRASTNLAINGLLGTTLGMLGWQHAFGDRIPWSTMQLYGIGAFSITATKMQVMRYSLTLE